MKITALKTPRVEGPGDLLALLDRSVRRFPEGAILAITSKIVSICQGRMVPVDAADKRRLVRSEADLLVPGEGRYGIMLTIKDSILIPAAGIDESNAAGHYILWPRAPQRVANRVRAHLRRRFGLRRVGVIITDSKTTPLRRGTTGVGLAHSGFAALNTYIGTPDLFGREMRVTEANVLDGLAAAAVAAMGEGRESTPLAVIEAAAFVRFQARNPTARELAHLQIPLSEDLYAPILRRAGWVKGRRT